MLELELVVLEVASFLKPKRPILEIPLEVEAKVMESLRDPPTKISVVLVVGAVP